MTAAPIELADIVREHGAQCAAQYPVSLEQARVLHDILRCRTAAMGGHVLRCNACGVESISYNSCRNRHCPRCQASSQKQWLADRQTELLPVDYFHLVFTVPHAIAPIALQNRAVIYDLLFRASWETIRDIAKNPRRLGATVGAIGILHTWGSNLNHHPHVHFLIPAGGLSDDRSQWVHARRGFFLSVRVLSRLFRGKFLALLTKARGRLSFRGTVEHLQDLGAFRSYLQPLYEKEWFVYAKAPFSSPTHVLSYLARYTHRIAISNRRLISCRDGNVSFRVKNYAKGGKPAVLTLSATEFLRRFLMHVLPKGFVRIRHFGFLANRVRKDRLARCRELLHAAQHPEQARCEAMPCSRCKQGTMTIVDWIPPLRSPRTVVFEPPRRPHRRAVFKPRTLSPNIHGAQNIETPLPSRPHAIQSP